MGKYTNLIETLIKNGWIDFIDNELRNYKLPTTFKNLKRYQIDGDYSYVINSVETKNNMNITEDIRLNDNFLIYEVFFSKKKGFPFIHWIFEYKFDSYIPGGMAEVQMNFFNKEKELIYSHIREIYIEDDVKIEMDYVKDTDETIKGQLLDIYAD